MSLWWLGFVIVVGLLAGTTVAITTTAVNDLELHFILIPSTENAGKPGISVNEGRLVVDWMGSLSKVAR